MELQHALCHNIAMAQSEKASPLSDGRLQRSERSREAIVQALLSLIREGDPRPTAERVAERAGVGIRTVFRHFSDMDSLFVQLHERLHAEMIPLLEKSEPGTLPERCQGLVVNLATFFERITPFRRSSDLQLWRSPFLKKERQKAATRLRQHLIEWLPELESAPPDVLEACNALASFEAWNRLRVTQELSRSRATKVIQEALLKLLKD
jgi:AcrR family transcriptional regulator